MKQRINLTLESVEIAKIELIRKRYKLRSIEEVIRRLIVERFELLK